ncbi:MAG TPA: lytic murein transglycosylase [Candidatus Paceibacterota bacterium]|nr:lytic murein transglycosylase [Candidatus Paceibacterota bacterium]
MASSTPPKPRIIEDISRHPDGSSVRRDAFSVIPERLNLKYERVVRVPVTKFLRAAIAFGTVASFFFGSAAAPTVFSQTTATSSITQSTDRAALQAQLDQLEGQINQYQDQITGYEKQGSSLKGEINILNDQIAKLNLQIRAITLTLSQINNNIADTQSQIADTQASIDEKKAALGALLQNLYASENASLIEVFLENPKLSDFFSDLNNITLLQSNLRATVQQITDLKGQLEDKQTQLVLAKSDAESVQAYQSAQKLAVASTTSQKKELLTQTKGQESKYQTLLAQSKQTAAQIRNRIFQLLGGGELSFEDAYQYAKLAGGATGIDPAFILAILDRESALGQNVGQCSYKTAMSPSNIPIFLDITKALGLDPSTMMVSCPNADGAYGGAMGPAQFVPSTWELYAGSIAKVTGHNPASPWNNADAFTATALYLQDAMTGCKSIYTAVASEERCTAAKYYAGGHWRSYLWTYGEAVVERAASFADDIKTIAG